MTDTTTAVAEVVNPKTGELLVLADVKPEDLDAAVSEAGRMIGQLVEFKQAVVEELARRADARGSRKVTLAGITYEVNSPTVDDFDMEGLRASITTLIEQGEVEQELLDSLIVRPPQPPRPPERVDKRNAATLMRSDNPLILTALAAARRRVPQKRTYKVIKRAVEGKEATGGN